MKVVTSIGTSIDQVHRYYGTDCLEDAMKHIHSEIVQYGFICWLPILEVCVSQNYLPENILDICMNYFLWKGDMKSSAEFAKALRFWRNKGLNADGLNQKLLSFSELVHEFSILEEEDRMKKIFTENIDHEIFHKNNSVLYSGLKSLYYNGYLEKIMLLRIYYSSNILEYKQIWEFGIRKLKFFTPYNPGIRQEWLNIYFSTVENDPSDQSLFDHILPDFPGRVERKQDLFLVLGFNKSSGSLIRMILFKQRGDRQIPLKIWRSEMFAN
jgi:hypothetical protein